MNDKKKFYRNIKKLFPIYGKKEREFLNSIKKQTNDLGDCDYDTLVEDIGEPTDILAAYYQDIDTDYIIKKLNMKKCIQYFCIIITVIILITCLWRTYVLNKAYEEVKEHQPVQVETTIE